MKHSTWRASPKWHAISRNSLTGNSLPHDNQPSSATIEKNRPYLSQFVGDPFLDFGGFGFDLFGIVESHFPLLVHLALQSVYVSLLLDHRVVEAT